MTMTEKWIIVVQTRSPIRRHHAQRATLIGLGLNRIRRAKVLQDTPQTRGMLRKVRHLVQVLEGPLLGDPTQIMKNDFELLRRFNRRVTRTEKSAFWRRYESQIPNVISRMENLKVTSTGPTSFIMKGTVHSFLEDFDQDEIAAFVLDFRQYTQNNDSISISSLARIYNQHWMDVGARIRFEEARAALNQALRAWSGLTFGENHMSVQTLVDIVVYGGLAHSNKEKAKIFESWEASGIMGFVWAGFFAAMRDLMHTLKQIRSLNEQVLSLYDSPTSDEQLEIQPKLPTNQ